MEPWFPRVWNELIAIRSMLDFIQAKRNVIDRKLVLASIEKMEAHIRKAKKEIDG